MSAGQRFFKIQISSESFEYTHQHGSRNSEYGTGKVSPYCNMTEIVINADGVHKLSK